MTATELRPQGTAPAAHPPARVDLIPPARPRFSLLHVPYLPNAVRESRHRMLIAILAVHVPLLILLGMDRHHGSRESAIVALPVLLATLAARFLRGREGRSLAVVLGLAWASYAVVYLDGGAPEAYLHPLFVVVLVALYQDPLLLGTGVVALAAACAVPAALHPGFVFAPRSAELRDPWPWTALHVLAIVGVAGAAALSWRRDVPVPVFADPAPGAAEPEPDPEVAEHIARARAAELALARRQATYALMTNLARRNQSLVGRQLATLDELERDERDPDVLAGLFGLDHLATRMRRNAENLLVLAGAPGGTSRSFARPVPVDELLRGAAAEVEQYARVTVSVGAEGGVAGHVVSDVAHLLAELLDNALACSPPDSAVVVGAAPATDGGLRLWVADEGIGMTAQRMAEHNAVLSDTSEETEVGASLGFPVVRRLAARHGIRVSLGAREGGQQGLVAYVDLPADLVVGTMAEVEATPAPAGDPATATALPGRRAAKRLSPSTVRTRRNQLAHEVAAEAWFQPAPLPAEGLDESADGDDVSAAPAVPQDLAPVPAPSEDVPAAVTAVPADVATASPTAVPDHGGAAEHSLPTRRRAADAGTDEGTETAPLDLAELREQFDAVEETDSGADGGESEVWTASGRWDAPVPSGAPYDDILFGPATVLPGAPLARRVPLQSLRDAGAPALFEPGPETGHPAEDAGASGFDGPVVDPEHATDMFAAYRAGLARARTVDAGAEPDTAPEDSTETPGEFA